MSKCELNHRKETQVYRCGGGGVSYFYSHSLSFTMFRLFIASLGLYLSSRRISRCWMIEFEHYFGTIIHVFALQWPNNNCLYP